MRKLLPIVGSLLSPIVSALPIIGPLLGPILA